MALTERLAIIITANGAQAMGEFQKVGRNAERSLQTVEQRSQRIGQGLTRAGAAMVGFGAVMATGMFMAARAAEEQNRAELELANTISNIPALAGASTGAFLDQADALMQVTVADDAAIVSMQAMLGTFHLTQDEILTATPLVVDYARKFGVDLVTAAKQVGKALSGNIGTLQRNGIMIDENAYATDRFSATMDALRENAGGFAEAEGATFSGQLEIMKNRLGEVAEGVGVGAVSAFGNLVGAVERVSSAFTGTSAGSQAFVGQLLTYGAVGSVAVGALSMIAGQLVRLKSAFDAAKTAVLAFRAAQGLGGLGAAAAATGGVLAVLGAHLWLTSKRNAEAQAATDRYTEALQRQNDVGDSAVYDAIAEGLAEIIPTMDRVGISVDQAADAIMDQGSAWEDLAATRLQLQRMSDSDKTPEQIQLERTIDLIGEQRAAYLAAQGDLDAAAAAQEALAGATQGTTGSLEEQQAALDELSQELDEFFNQTFGVSNAADDVEDAFDRLFQSVLENGPVFEGMTQQARDNRDAMEGVVTSTASWAESLIAANAPASEVNAVLNATRDRLQAARDAGLISASAFDYYSGVLDDVRPIVTTAVQTPGLPGATSAMRELRSTADYLNGRTVRVTAIADVIGLDQMRELRSTTTRYFGGPVPGPSSQAVPMTLHGGEYVLSADVVDRIKSGRSSRGAGQSTSGGGGGGTVYNIEVNGAVGPPDEIARKMMAEIRKLEKAVAA